VLFDTDYTACPSHIFTFYNKLQKLFVSVVLDESDNESDNQMDSVTLTPSATP